MTMQEENHNLAFTPFIRQLALEAGHLLRQMQPHIRPHDKGFRDSVTEADFAAQKLIKDRVRAHFPTAEHGFWSEEDDGEEEGSADYRWIIDPIDGTSNYLNQRPLYCVSIGLAYKMELITGVIYDPSHDELFWAEKGGGSYCNGRRLQVGAVDRLSEARLACDWSRPNPLRQQTAQQLASLSQLCRNIRSYGSAALITCWIADDRMDGYFNHALGAWDVAASALILQEAGGAVSGFHGQPFALSDPTSWLVASNQQIHAELLAALDASA